VQARGWRFNADEEYQLSKDSNNEIHLPKNALRVNVSRRRHFGDDYVERGRKLYDRKEQTYNIDKDVYVDIVFFLDFEELPESARTYIAMRASREFVSDILPNEMGYQTVSQEETQAWAQLLRDHSLGHFNMFKNKVYKGSRGLADV
jgi:hypothetical protein